MVSTLQTNSSNDKKSPLAWGIGIARTSPSGQILDVYYPIVGYNSFCSTGRLIAEVLEYSSGNVCVSFQSDKIKKTINKLGLLPSEQSERSVITMLNKLMTANEKVIATFIDEDLPCSSTQEVYLKLTLISKRLARPRELNLDGIFGVLPNVAWTSEGPIDISDLEDSQADARFAGRTLEVFSIDKFPRMTNYVALTDVRIADGARVRLGAYLGPGTTVMHEGFVNFNAGCEGPNMVEGRISAGVFVSSGTDLGGGCSIMGTLSGGNDIVISIGKDCLIGANAGVGIPLGDNCTIESGLYITAGSKVALLDDTMVSAKELKAIELAGKPNLLFRRNSLTGTIEVLPNKTVVQLNEELHRVNT